jgi:hypothetical protein
VLNTSEQPLHDLAPENLLELPDKESVEEVKLNMNITNISHSHLIYCSLCGSVGKELSCCQYGTQPLQLEVTKYKISDNVKFKYTKMLQEMQRMGLDSFYVVDDNNKRNEWSLHCYSPTIVTSLNNDVAKALMNKIKTSTEVVNGSYFNNYVNRPWSLSASSLCSQASFKSQFNSKAVLYETKNIESKFIDKFLSKCMWMEGQEDLQFINRLYFEEAGLSVPVYAKPDAIWIHEGVRYVIEFKTIKYKTVKQSNMEKWLKQVAGYQLADDLQANDDFTSNGGIPMVTKYLLFIIFLPRHFEPQLAKCTIVDVNVGNNLAKCKSAWFDWFQIQSDGPKCLDYKKIHLLNKYHSNSINLKQLLSEYRNSNAA